MAKIKKSFFCSNCGFESSKWLGRCSECGEWNSFTEEIVVKESTGKRASFNMSVRGESSYQHSTPIVISDIQKQDLQRIDMRNNEVNRVLGGGLVPGSLVLIGGEPGIGKSTLSLQLALHAQDIDTLYVSAEESPQQIKIRADRLSVKNDRCLVLSETSIDIILEQLRRLKPQLVIIDSIQTIYTENIDSSPGGVSQIRECAAMLLRYAKETNTPIFIIGHITKDGTIAGPKVLEHIVDVVFQFEGDTNNIYRILRSIKNRFGATSEIGVFEMRNNGLIEVPNPSEILLSHHDTPLSGVAIGATMDGTRPYLMEVQSLVGSTTYPSPQRTTTGFDIKRLNMLLAVIEKHLNFRMSSKDVFLNIAGGFKVSDPGVDMAVVAAIISSSLDMPIPSQTCFAGEIGLSGEIRPAGRTEARITEASRLGFKRIFVSNYVKKSLTKTSFDIDIVYIGRVEELAKRIF